MWIRLAMGVSSLTPTLQLRPYSLNLCFFGFYQYSKLLPEAILRGKKASAT
jgi:hypothetical protein